MITTADTSTRAVGQELLLRIGELYAEHGRTELPWIRRRSTRADAADHFRELAALPHSRLRRVSCRRGHDCAAGARRGRLPAG